MKPLSNFNIVYHIVLLNDRRTHILRLFMILILGKKISVENQSVRFYMYSVYLSLTFSICQQSVGVSQAINIRKVQL